MRNKKTWAIVLVLIGVILEFIVGTYPAKNYARIVDEENHKLCDILQTYGKTCGYIYVK